MSDEKFAGDSYPPSRAEDRFERQIASLPNLAPDEIAQLVHELDTRRIGLQRQNDELRASHQLIEQACARFADLYDLAPLGYVMLDGDGWIKELNGTAAALLEAERASLLKTRLRDLVVPEDRPLLEQHLIQCCESTLGAACELRLRGKKGHITPVELRSAAAETLGSGSWYRTAIIDLTERKRAEKAIEDHDLRLRQAMQIGNCYPFEWNTITDEVVRTADCAEILGLTHEEAMRDTGQRYFQRVVPEDRNRFMEVVHGLTPAAPMYTTSYRLARGDGSIAHFEETARGFFDSNDCLVQVLGTVADVTARERAEELLHQSEERFHTLVRKSDDGIVIINSKGRVLEWNESEERITGIPRSDAVGQFLWDILDRLTPDKQHVSSLESGARGRILQALAEEDRLHRIVEEEFQRPDGTRRTVQSSVFAIRSGSEIFACGICRDVTEKKNADLLLRQSSERLALAQRAAGLGIWDIDLVTGRVKWTPEMFELFALEGDNQPLSMDAWKAILHPEDRKGAMNQFKQCLHDRALLNSEYRIVLPGGEIRWINAIGKGEYDATGLAVRMVGVCMDVTRRKHGEQQLITLNETLEDRVNVRTAEAQRRANQLQQLAAQMTQAEERERRRLAQILHDSLQQILVAAKLRLRVAQRTLREGPAGDAIQQAHHLVEEAIGESRSLAKELSPPVLYDGGLAAGLEWLGNEAERKYQLPVIVAVAPATEPEDLTTKVLLFQAARELILNAVKHASASSLKVSLAAAHDSQLQLVVEDDGTGFDPADLDREHHGAGFGLFSIRERLDVIGGQLTLASAPGESTKATILVPFQRSQRPNHRLDTIPVRPLAPPDLSPNPNQQIRILLADDHPALRKGLADAFREHLDLHVIGEARNGLEAVKMAIQLRPDVVLVDITMPFLDGIEATRQIKESMPETCVIGLSMHETEEMIAAMKNAGASDYLTKTASTEDMISAILRARPRA